MRRSVRSCCLAVNQETDESENQNSSEGPIDGFERSEKFITSATREQLMMQTFDLPYFSEAESRAMDDWGYKVRLVDIRNQNMKHDVY
jgi:hypothetical protein